MTWLPLLPQTCRSIALALAVVLPALALAYAGHGGREQARVDRDSAAASYQRREAELRQMAGDREERDRQAAIFRRLQASGLVGEPAPLEWIELLETLRQQLLLPALQYELAPPAGTGSGDFDFHATAMRLRLQLVHEEDLLLFLERLQQEAKALVLVRSCRVARLPADAAATPPAHLSADCQVDWALAYRKAVAQP